MITAELGTLGNGAIQNVHTVMVADYIALCVKVMLRNTNLHLNRLGAVRFADHRQSTAVHSAGVVAQCTAENTDFHIGFIGRYINTAATAA